jgi:hypothetical protein
MHGYKRNPPLAFCPRRRPPIRSSKRHRGTLFSTAVVHRGQLISLPLSLLAQVTEHHHNPESLSERLDFPSCHRSTAAATPLQSAIALMLLHPSFVSWCAPDTPLIMQDRPKHFPDPAIDRCHRAKSSSSVSCRCIVTPLPRTVPRPMRLPCRCALSQGCSR